MAFSIPNFLKMTGMKKFPKHFYALHDLLDEFCAYLVRHVIDCSTRKFKSSSNEAVFAQLSRLSL